MLTIRFNLGERVSVPLMIEDGKVTERTEGIVTAISVTQALGTRFRVEWTDENEVVHAQEHDDDQVEPA